MRNCSIEISVRPTLATVDTPKPRKMSPIPQIPKLMIRNPTTAAMTTLPSQLEEAFRRPRSMSAFAVLSELERCSLPLPSKRGRERVHDFAETPAFQGTHNREFKWLSQPPMPRQTSAPSWSLPQNRGCLLGRGLLADGYRRSDGQSASGTGPCKGSRVGIRHGGRLHLERPRPAASRVLRRENIDYIRRLRDRPCYWTGGLSWHPGFPAILGPAGAGFFNPIPPLKGTPRQGPGGHETPEGLSRHPSRVAP